MRMTGGFFLMVLLAGALSLPAIAPATDGSFNADLDVRPAKGKLDASRGGLGSLNIRRWKLRTRSGSDGIDPANEPIIFTIGERTQFAIPAGRLTVSKNGKRFRYLDKETTEGVAKFKMKARHDGSYTISVKLLDIVMDQLLVQSPFCETFSLEVGNDEAFSGILLDRPRGDASPRIKLRGFCSPDACRDAFGAALTIAGARGVTARHSACPTPEL